MKVGICECTVCAVHLVVRYLHVSTVAVERRHVDVLGRQTYRQTDRQTTRTISRTATALLDSVESRRRLETGYGKLSIGNESVPKIIISGRIKFVFFLNSSQHFGNFKPYQLPIAV